MNGASILQRLGFTVLLLGTLACPMLVHAAVASGATAMPAKRQIIAYVFPRDHALQPDEIAANKLTRINYAFANIKDGLIVSGAAVDEANFATLHTLKRQNPSLQVLVSVGGWLWSGNFSDVALTRRSRDQFIGSVVTFLDHYQLDGLDVDWEYPGMKGAGNRFRPADKRNYTLLLKELRTRFDLEQRSKNRRLLLTIAAGASTEFIAHTEMNRVHRFVDTINLMAYDYYEPGSEKITGNHAPLYTDPADPKHVSADRSVREFEQAGVPARKIVLGVPFYGHVWGAVAKAGNGLFQPGSSVPGAFANYDNITANMLGHGFTRHWDAASSVPYLYSEQKQQFVSYEDAESLNVKCAYVLRKGLGGVMFWDYSGDTSGALLNAIDGAFDGAMASPRRNP